MWLWILGAYEVVRTISQAKTCFSITFMQELAPLKKQLATIRMPSAKMEKAGAKVPVSSNRSPSDLDEAESDLLLGDPEGTVISARHLLQEFERVFATLTPADVLRGHEESYPSV